MPRLRTHHYLLITGAIVAAAALTLFFMGQIPMCKCGYVKLWHGVVASSENSQHVADWYTFSHVIHGFGFYGLLWLVGRRPSAQSGRPELIDGSAMLTVDPELAERVEGRWPLGLRLVVAMLLEASWEIFENTDFTINRYRSVTISLDYYGDSVLNSACDMLAMALGFFVASRLPVWGTLALVVALEAFVGYWIRDNLALNIIMLIYPLDAIRAWQMGGAP